MSIGRRAAATPRHCQRRTCLASRHPAIVSHANSTGTATAIWPVPSWKPIEVGGSYFMMAFTRRQLLAAFPGAALMGMPAADAQTIEKTLIATAKGKNLIYGAAVASWETDQDTVLRRTFDRQCGIVVPEWEMKWGTIEATRGTRNYTGADRVVSFAASHGLACRGHAA